MSDEIIKQLKLDETRDGKAVTKPYLDCCGKYWRLCTCANKGKLTISFGRNLDDVGISDGEAEVLLWNDVNIATRTLTVNQPWMTQLSDARFGVLQNLCFNLGFATLCQFQRFLTCLKNDNFEGAAKELQDSRWAEQVGDRAQRLIKQMLTDTWVFKGEQ